MKHDLLSFNNLKLLSNCFNSLILITKYVRSSVLKTKNTPQRDDKGMQMICIQTKLLMFFLYSPSYKHVAIYVYINYYHNINRHVIRQNFYINTNIEIKSVMIQNSVQKAAGEYIQL